MFTDTSFKKFVIDENHNSIGNVEVNMDILQNEKFNRPFIRENIIREIVKVGNRDYQKLDQIIIDSLKDYYNRLLGSALTERTRMLKTYERLYGMWQELHNLKISKNLEEIEKMYDLFLYELYILGYIKE